MLRSSQLWGAVGLASGLLAPWGATAAVWSIEAECKRGDWSVGVDLVGFGAVDASCAGGMETRIAVDVGDEAVTGGSIAATSSSGTLCAAPESIGSKFALKCANETEDATGFELEEELEVEVEREESDEIELEGE